MNLQHVIKVRGTVCSIKKDFGNGVIHIHYRGQVAILDSNKDLLTTRLSNGKFIGLDAELHKRN